MNHHDNGEHVAHFAALEDNFSQLSFFFSSTQQSPGTAARYVRLLRTLSSEALAAADALEPVEQAPPNVQSTPSAREPVRPSSPNVHSTPTPPPRNNVAKNANEAAARYQSIKSRPLVKTSPIQLYELLTTPRKRQHSKEEDDGFHRLLCGYWAADQDEWNTVFANFAQPPATIAALVNQSITRDGQSSADSLLSRDLGLYTALPAQAATRYVDYLYHAIETIKFMRQWNTLDSVPNGRKLKSQHLQDLFRNLHLDRFETIELLREWEQEDGDGDSEPREEAERNLEKLRQLFLSRHSYLTKARNSFLTLYEHFGGAVLLDPVWDIHTHHTTSGITGRSVQFRALLAIFHKSAAPPSIKESDEALKFLMHTVGLAELMEGM